MTHNVPVVPKLFGASTGRTAPTNTEDELFHLSSMASTLPNSTRGAATPPRPQSARLFGSQQPAAAAGRSTNTSTQHHSARLHSAELLLSQTQRNLERTMREKHDLERTVMSLESELEQLQSELAAVQSSHRSQPRGVQPQPQSAASLDPEMSQSISRAYDFIGELYEDAPDDDVGVVDFLVDRLRDLQVAEQQLAALESERETTRDKFSRLSAEWGRKEVLLEQRAVEIQKLKAEVAAARSATASKNHSPTSSSSPLQTPKKPLFEQLRVGDIMAQVRRSADALEQHLQAQSRASPKAKQTSRPEDTETDDLLGQAIQRMAQQKHVDPNGTRNLDQQQQQLQEKDEIIRYLKSEVERLEKENTDLSSKREAEEAMIQELDLIRRGREEMAEEVAAIKSSFDEIAEIFGRPVDSTVVDEIYQLKRETSSKPPEGRWHKNESLIGPLPDVADITQRPLPKRVPLNVADWDFDTVRKTENITGGPLYQVGVNVAAEVGFCGALVDADTWGHYLLAIQAGYCDVPYHNATHAADITHALYSLLKQTGLYDRLTPLERFAAIAAAAAHDFQHPGRNNGFLAAIHDPVAMRTNDRSVLEAHHVAAAFDVIAFPGADVTAKLSDADAKRFRDVFVSLILGTDMAQHGGHLAEFNRRCDTKPYDLDSPTDRLEVLRTLLHVADISNPAKDVNISVQWAERVTAEFHAQGREEIKRGLPISMGCDPSVTNIAPSQIGFYDFVVLPLLRSTARCLPALQKQIDHVLAGREYWAKRCDKPPGPPPAAPSSSPKTDPAAEDVSTLQQLLLEHQELAKQLAEENLRLSEEAAEYAAKLLEA